MLKSHTFQQLLINHHYSSLSLLYTHGYHSLSLCANPLKCLLSSFSPWLWSSSVITVLQDRRDGVWCWIAAWWSLLWSHHRCTSLIPSLLHLSGSLQDSLFISMGNSYCNTMDMTCSSCNSGDIQHRVTSSITQFKSQAVFTQDQILLRYTSEFPILPHYPPSTPMSLSKSHLTDGFAFAWGRNYPGCLPQHIFLHTTGTLSLSIGCKSFDWAGPDLLAGRSCSDN